jgi:hypothetical protein
MNVFNFKFSPLWDVKILYELAGYDFKNLIDLGKIILGEGKLEIFIELSSRINAHLNSYKVSKIDINRYCRTEIIPSDLLERFYRERASIIAQLYHKFDDKEILDFYSSIEKTAKSLHVVSKEPVHIDLDVLGEHRGHYVSSINKNIVDGKLYLKFNVVGAKTGRLSFKKGTPNIYGMPKEMRNCIVAPQDYKIVQFDFKSFQPRLAIFSTDDEEFKDKFRGIDDIYSIFPGDRKKNKLLFIAWMFSEMKNDMFGEEASAIQELRKKLYQEVKREGRLINKFGRVLHFGEEKRNVVLQNYITSLEVDAILTLVRCVEPILRARKSRILFPFHDAIVFLVHKEENNLVALIKDFMEKFHQNTLGTTFPVEVREGYNFGEMKSDPIW